MIALFAGKRSVAAPLGLLNGTRSIGFKRGGAVLSLIHEKTICFDVLQGFGTCVQVNASSVLFQVQIRTPIPNV